jgi:hypothetical protein
MVTPDDLGDEAADPTADVLGLLADFGAFKGDSVRKEQVARRCVAMGITTDDVVWLHQYFRETETRMGDVGGLVAKRMSTGTEWRDLLQDIRRVSNRKASVEADAAAKVYESAAAQEERLQREFVVAAIQERRTVEWIMMREKLPRSRILRWLVADAPYVVQEPWYAGPEHWDELPREFPENWRRHDEAAAIHQERIAGFTAAHRRKAERRRAAGQPPPPLFLDDPAADPEDMAPADFATW